MDADLVLEGGGPAALARTMFVDTFGVRPTDFDIDESIQDTLFKSGRKTANTFGRLGRRGVREDVPEPWRRAGRLDRARLTGR